MAGERLLVSTTRRVPVGGRVVYREEWEGLAAAVREQGANAWRFQSVSDPDRYIEFIEYGEADPRAHPEVARALRRLDAAHSGRTNEWRPPDEDTQRTDD